MHNYFLLHIKDNLLFVKPNATDDEINDVLQKSACQNLLLRAENGLTQPLAKEELKFLVEKTTFINCSLYFKTKITI
jgi:ABC-type multidrug transport system fused ATPase/permease subunit